MYSSFYKQQLCHVYLLCYNGENMILLTQFHEPNVTSLEWKNRGNFRILKRRQICHRIRTCLVHRGVILNWNIFVNNIGITMKNLRRVLHSKKGGNICQYFNKLYATSNLKACIRSRVGPIPLSVSEISAYRHFFEYLVVSVSAVSAVSAKASIGISAYRQECGIGPSLIRSLVHVDTNKYNRKVPKGCNSLKIGLPKVAIYLSVKYFQTPNSNFSNSKLPH